MFENDGGEEGEEVEEVEGIDSSEETQEVYFLRVVRESVLQATGRAAKTGLHFVFYGPAAAGRDAWQVGQAWGWTREELAAMHAAGDHLVGVLQTPGDRWGLASADAVATLLAGASGPKLGASAEKLLAAITCPPAEVRLRGVGPLRERIAAALDMPVGALSRLPRRGEEAGELAFLLDEKVNDEATDGLAPDSSLPVAEYPDLATVVRLPWGKS